MESKKKGREEIDGKKEERLSLHAHTHTFLELPHQQVLHSRPRAHVHVVCRPAVTQEAPSRNLQIKDQLGSISRQHAGNTRCALMVVAVETVGRVRNFLKSYQLRGSGEI